MTEKELPKIILAPGFGFRVIGDKKCVNVFLDNSIFQSQKIAAILSQIQLGEQVSKENLEFSKTLYNIWKNLGGKISNINRFNGEMPRIDKKLNFDSLTKSSLRLKDKASKVNWNEIKKWVKNKGMKMEMRDKHPFKKDLIYKFPITVIKNQRGDVISEGKGFTKVESERSALGEAIERILSKAPINRFNIIYAKYSELSKKEEFQIETGPRDLFNKELITEWSPAYSLSNDKMTWIPTEMAYMGYIPSNGIRAFGLHHTTGLSAGASIEEATINGIFEVLERDAYWNVMRCRLNCPDISFDNFKSKKIQRIIKFCSKNKLKIVIKDISLDWEIPIAHVTLVSVDQSMPGFSHGTGASFDWMTSISRALLEALQVYSGLSEIVKYKWDSITNVHGVMGDGRMAWTDPLFYPHIKHLIEKSKKEFIPKKKITNVRDLIGRLNRRKHKIFTSELNNLYGLHVVRVYISGATQPDERLERIGWRLQNNINRYCKDRGAYCDPILT